MMMMMMMMMMAVMVICESSFGSYDKCRTLPSLCRPSELDPESNCRLLSSQLTGVSEKWSPLRHILDAAFHAANTCQQYVVNDAGGDRSPTVLVLIAGTRDVTVLAVTSSGTRDVRLASPRRRL